VRWRAFGDPWPLFWSVFLFVAWLIAATGWVRWIAVIWLIYPAFVAWRVVGRRD
jgi:hypothetical protein